MISPETIPWLVCGAVCILPFLIGTLAFFGLRILASRNAVHELTRYTDGARRVIRTEWSMLSREEQQVHEEEKE